MSTQHCGRICDLTLGQAGFPLALVLAMVAKPYKNRTEQFKTPLPNRQKRAMQRVGITKQYIKCFFCINNSQLGANILCTWHKTRNIWESEINKVWWDGGSRSSLHSMHEISC